MKSAAVKDFLREIKKSPGRFLSLVLIVALGVAFFSGVRSSEPDMRLSVDRNYDELHFFDIRIIGTLGLTDGDIEAVKAVEGIEDAEGEKTTEALCQIDGVGLNLQIRSLPRNINLTRLLSGRMPDKAGECAVDSKLLGRFAEGDTIVLFGDGDELSDTLNITEYVITGFVNEAEYISFTRGTSTIGNGKSDGFLYVSPEAFKTDYYTAVYALTGGTLPLTAFEKTYEDAVESVRLLVEKLEDERCRVRFAEVVDEAKEAIADARAEYNDKKKEADDKIAEAEQKIKDGEKELKDAEQKLSDGEKEIEDAKKELEDAKKELEDGKEDLKKAEKDYADGKDKLNNGWEEYYKAKSQLEKNEAGLTKAQKELKKAEAELEKNEKKLNDAKKEYEINSRELNAAKAEIEKNEKALEAAEAELEKNTEAYNTALAQYEAARDTLPKEAAAAMAAELKATKAKLDEAKKELEKNRSELKKAAAPVNKGFAALKAAEKELEEGRAQIDAGKSELKKNQNELKKAKAKLEDGKKTLKASYAELADNEDRLKSAEKEISEAKEKLADGEKEISDGEKEIADAEKELEEGKREIADANQKLEDGKEELEEAKKEAKEKLDDADKKITDAERDIEDIEFPEWYVLDRNSTVDYVEFGMDTERIGNLGKVFPAIFFLVAALVSLTAMTRMVEEKRTEIGTWKALGYGHAAISAKFMLYAFIACLAGSVIGIAVGGRVLPYVIQSAYFILYVNIPYILAPIQWELALTSALIATGTVMAATWLACFRTLLAVPAQLMRPTPPKSGKRILLERIGLIWNRLSFIRKATFRNLFRFKKRFFMTVFGIGGCMALLLVGFGLRDSVAKIVDTQYYHIWTYDAQVNLSKDADFKDIERAVAGRAEVESMMLIYRKTHDFRANGVEKTGFVFVPQSADRVGDFVLLRDRNTPEIQYDLESSKAVVTEKLARSLSLAAGSGIEVSDGDFDAHRIAVSAITENYLFHYVYMLPDTYSAMFGEAVAYNELLLKLGGISEDEQQELASFLMALDDVESVTFVSELQEHVSNMMRSLDLVIWVLILSAGLLAFVVLFNLNSINITERHRELATLKVLGFYDGEVSHYVYRENIILTLMGIAAGIFMGIWLHGFVIKTVEIDMLMFGQNISPVSFMASSLLTLLFSAAVNGVMFFILRKIDMIESLKSVE